MDDPEADGRASMVARLKDVAERAGVSVKTVSNVVHDYPFVSALTRARVRSAIDELGYQPNISARGLRTGRTGLIALSVPEIDAPYFAELAALVVDAAEREGWTVLVDQTRGRRRHEQATASGIQANLIDGCIASPLAMTEEDIHALAGRRPLVLLGERLARSGADHVAVDSIAAGRDATDHLLAIGRRRVAAIGAQDVAGGTAALRLAGYRQALAAAGLDADSRLVAAGGDFHRSDGLAGMRALLDLPDPPDAVFCFNDLLALGALRAVHEAGLRAPQDVAVIGIDDIKDGRFSVPTLSTIAPDGSALAETAVALLADRIADGRHPPRDVVVGHRLVVRESTAT